MTNRSDVLIIGGGVVGLCTAYYLRQQGQSVTLIDKGAIGSGSSFGNAGLIPPSHSIPLAAPGVLLQGIKWMLNPSSPFYIKPRLDLELIRWLWNFRAACSEETMHRHIPPLRDLLYASHDLYQKLIDEEAFACDYAKRGALLLFNTEAGFDHADEEVTLLSSYGAAVRVLSGDETRAVEPFVSDNVVGSVHYQDDAHLHPSRFMDALTQRVEALGVNLLTFTEVTDFAIDPERRRHIDGVRSGDQLFTADTVVLAAGAWTSSLARALDLRVPIQPTKGYSLSIPMPPDGPSVPVLAHESRFAVTPMGDTLRFAGTLEMSGLNLDISPRRVDAIRNAAPAYLNLNGPVPPTNVWVGMRPCTPDGLPIISRIAEYDNLIVAAGHAMLGMALGPITGKSVAQLINGEPPDLGLEPFRANRW